MMKMMKVRNDRESTYPINVDIRNTFERYVELFVALFIV